MAPEPKTELVPQAAPVEPEPAPAPAPATSAAPREVRSDAPLGLHLDGFSARAALIGKDGVEVLELGDRVAPLVTSIKLNEQGRLEFSAATDVAPSPLLRDALPLLGKRRDGPELKDRLEWGVTPLLLAGTGEPDLLWQGQTFNAMALTVTAARAVKGQAEQTAGRLFPRAVVCVPVALGDAERRAWRSAFAVAGFEVAAFVNVTSAVALAYAHRRSLARKRLLCVHLDPYFLEACVAEVTGADAEIALAEGDLLADASPHEPVEHFIIRLRQALELQGLPLNKMDGVLFSGRLFEERGLRETVEHLLGARASEFPEAPTAAAVGAALYAESREAAAHGQKGLVLSELLGSPVDVTLTPGASERLFERGMRLPAEKSLSQRVKGGEEVELALFEGLARRFSGLARVKAERSGEMSFSLTATPDGTLDVTVTLPGGKKHPVKLSLQELPRSMPRPAGSAPPPGSAGLIEGITKIFRRKQR